MSITSSLKDAFFIGDYPPSAFHFKVILSSTSKISDTSFQEVSGIGSTVATREISEGGLNEARHQAFESITHDNLVLKRGLAPISSPLVGWCKSVFEMDFREPIVPQPILVMLMNGDRAPVRVWSFNEAYPVSWKIDAFGSTKNEVAIETIEFKHKGLMRVL